MAFRPEGDMSRFDFHPELVEVHTNDTLQCRDCRYRRRPVGDCEKYPDRKPKHVLKAAGPCEYYEPKKGIFRK